MKKAVFSILLAVAIMAPAAPAIAENAGTEEASLKICGCVSGEVALKDADTRKLPRVFKCVKVLSESGDYKVSCEASGAPLSKAIDLAAVKKVKDDGFDRTLDMYVTVKARSGKTALFSYGEIFLNKDLSGAVLAASYKLIYPHKHTDFTPLKFNIEKSYGVDEVSRTSLETCAACHNGTVEKKMAFPKGFGVAVGGRFMEDVTEIKIHQADVLNESSKASSDKERMWSESFTFINIDGATGEVKMESLQGLSSDTCEDVTVGLGKGFHGKHIYEGFDFAEFIKSKLGGSGVSPDDFYVIATACDGYRCLFSGNELFSGYPDSKNVMLVHKEDGRNLEKGEGRFKIFVKNDFFVDRCIRSVAKIQICKHKNIEK